MGFFDQFTQEPAGYLEQNGEDSFPWAETGRSVWYLLIVVERGETLFYGFTSSRSQKENLVMSLSLIKPGEISSKLLGVWHGKHYTKLFDLNIEIARRKLAIVLQRFSRDTQSLDCKECDKMKRNHDHKDKNLPLLGMK